MHDEDPVRHRPRWRPPPSRLELWILGTGFVLAAIAGVATYQLGGPYGERLRDEPGAGRVYAAVQKQSKQIRQRAA